jgi:AcrR family transcriptional regulator
MENKTRATSTKGAKSNGSSRGRGGRAAAGSLNGARARDREVIEAAVQIFWEKGYASASVQDVADALGMLKGSLYYYIDSKESLLDKIFQDSHDDLMRLTQVAVEGEGPAVDRLVRFLHDYAMWTLTHLERAGLYSREWRYASDALRATLVEQQRYYDRSLRKLITAGQEEASLDKAVDPRTASLFIWAAFTGLPDWFRSGTKAEAEAVATKYVDLALRACGGSAPSATATRPTTRKRRTTT